MITWIRMAILLFCNKSSEISFFKHCLFPFCFLILSLPRLTSSRLFLPRPSLSRSSVASLPFHSYFFHFFPFLSFYLLYFILFSIVYRSFSCYDVFIHLLTFTVLPFISISTSTCVAETTDNFGTNTTMLTGTWATFVNFYGEKKR